MLTAVKKNKLAAQLTSWKGFIEASFARMCGDMAARFGDDDLANELYLTGHALVEQGFDPEEDAALFKRAYINRIRDLIDYHKAACRNIHRDLTNFDTGANSARNDIDEEAGFDQFGNNANDYADFDFSSDVEILDPHNDEGTPDEMVEIRDTMQTILNGLHNADERALWDAITNVGSSLLSRWENRKRNAKRTGTVVRTDGRTPLGLPWQVWADHMDWSVARVKKCMHEIRLVTFRVLGRKTVFGSGVSTYAHMQLPEEVL